MTLGIDTLDNTISQLTAADKKQLENNVKTRFDPCSLEEISSLMTSERLTNWMDGGLNPYIRLGSQGVSLFHVAVSHGAEQITRCLHVNGLEELFSNSGQSVLHTAAQLNELTCAFMVGAQYPDLLNHKDCYQQTALAIAVERCNEQALLGLVLAGADRQGLSVEGKPPRVVKLITYPYSLILSECLRSMTKDDIIYTLADDARLTAVAHNIDNPNVKLGVNEISLLHVAVLGRHSSALTALLHREGIDLNVKQGMDNRTPLMLAAMTGNVMAAEQLLYSRCDVACRDYRGSTAYGLAVDAGEQRIAELLLQYGAAPELSQGALESRNHLPSSHSVVGRASGVIDKLTPVKDNSQAESTRQGAGGDAGPSGSRKRGLFPSVDNPDLNMSAAKR